jgi:antitoxin (DNA-binding transcriptional repressor) of toxin-antitoxin stability system
MTKRRTLTKSLTLMGQSETITAMDFRKTPGDVLLQAQMGKTFTITKNGVAVATLSPIEMNALELGAEIRRLGLAGATPKEGK